MNTTTLNFAVTAFSSDVIFAKPATTSVDWWDASFDNDDEDK